MPSEIMLELAEELVNPSDVVLDKQIEDVIDTEIDSLLGVGEDDDDVIDFIDHGGRLGNSDPVDFTDDDVDDVVEDDIREEDVSEQVNIDDIEDSYTFIY